MDARTKCGHDDNSGAEQIVSVAGADGISLAFCDRSERDLLRDIEKLTRRKLTVIDAASFAQRRAA